MKKKMKFLRTCTCPKSEQLVSVYSVRKTNIKYQYETIEITTLNHWNAKPLPKRIKLDESYGDIIPTSLKLKVSCFVDSTVKELKDNRWK